MSNFADTQVIEAKYEAVFGAHLYSVIKSRIAVILRKNGFSVAYEDFVFRVVLTKTSEHEEDVEFDIVSEGVVDEEESAALALGMQRNVVMGECQVEFDGQLIPRLVVVQYAQDRTIVPEVGNLYAPVSSSFEQRGMVMDLESGEVLCPGISWVKTVDDIQVFEDIYSDELHRPRLQIPVEGANVTFFQDPKDGNIYICTGHRVMRIDDIIRFGGSKWNFYGKGFQGESSGVLQFDHGSRYLDIHLAAVECIGNAALEVLGVTEIGDKSQIADLLYTSVHKVFFEKSANLVITGILTGKAFAGRSMTLTEEDLEQITFTPTAYLERNFWESGRTQWVQEADEKLEKWAALDRVFSSVCLDVTRFEIIVKPSEYYKTYSPVVWMNHPLSNKEDLLIIQHFRENGSRGVYRFRTPETIFRDSVLRGTPAELEEVKDLFPKHRARSYATPATIRERVHQIITLSIVGKQEYAFQSIDVLGSLGAKIFGGYVRTAVSSLVSSSLLEHWMDIAFPVSDFAIKTSELDKVNIPRMLNSPVNRKVCNGLSVLYACASDCIRPKIIEATADFFASRVRVAAVAFLPASAFSKAESEYMKTHPAKEGHLPVGVHKLRNLRTFPDTPASAAQRKYKLAGRLTRNTVLDIQFMDSVASF